MEKYQKYLCSSWKNFLYVLLTNIAQGYWYFSVFQYPEQKREKWSKIDRKMLQKYPILLSKDQRYRRKKKGKANFRFFRWENQAVFLRTEGEYIPPRSDENWRKIEGKTVLPILVGSLVFEIKNQNRKFSIKLSKQNFRDIKAEIKEKLEKKNIDYALKIFNNLNGLPNFKFLFIQKREIQKFFIKEYKRNFMKSMPKYLKEKLIIKKVPIKSGELFINS